MTETFEIYFEDLTPEAQENLLEKFQTTEEGENWDSVPLAVIEREITEPAAEDPYP